MTHRIAEISITLSDLQGHSFIASLFKLNFSYRCAAVDKISTYSASWGPYAITKLLIFTSYRFCFYDTIRYDTVDLRALKS